MTRPNSQACPELKVSRILFNFQTGFTTCNRLHEIFEKFVMVMEQEKTNTYTHFDYVTKIFHSCQHLKVTNIMFVNLYLCHQTFLDLFA